MVVRVAGGRKFVVVKFLIALTILLIATAGWAEDLDSAMAAAIDPEQGGRRNITLGAMFQEEFRQHEGVKELKSGILYRAEASGAGRTPKLSDRVKVRYEGRHVDGRVFDKSKGEESQEFRVDRTVAGWQEVLPLMREGDKWEVVVPSHLAYGAKGSPFGNIGPNETLVFTIELVHILDPAEKSSPLVSP